MAPSLIATILDTTNRIAISTLPNKITITKEGKVQIEASDWGIRPIAWLVVNRLTVNTVQNAPTIEDTLTENFMTKLLPKEEAQTKTTIIPPKNMITNDKKNQDIFTTANPKP